MKCPIDGTELASHRYEADIDVDKCEKCGGMWLDYKELERIQDVSEKDYSEEIKQLPDLIDQAQTMVLQRSRPELQCPTCGQVMERREHGYCSQIMIDVCPSCRGVWLDRGELEALEVFFERTESETRQTRFGFFSRLIDFFR